MHGQHFLVLAILCFICVTSILIVLHELGHYLTARAFGLKAKTFSLGLGPELAGVTDRHGTRWVIAPIPLGGFVKFHGVMHPGTGTADEAAHPQSFASLARWKRALVIFAGPFANMLVTAAILGTMFGVYGIPRIGDRIQEVQAGSVAAAAGIKPGDHLVSWDGKKPDGSQRFIRHVKINPDSNVDLRLSRQGRDYEREVRIARVPVEDRFGNRADIGRVGVTFDQTIDQTKNPFLLVGHAASETGNLFTMQIETIWQMIRGERSLSEVSGPVRLAKFSGEQWLIGWLAIINFTAVLSIAIAFMNLLPVPGLDGGYLALYGVETLARRDLSARTFANSVKVGYGIVAALAVFGLFNDIHALMG